MSVNRLTNFDLIFIPVTPTNADTASIPENYMWTGALISRATAPVLAVQGFSDLTVGTFTSIQRSVLNMLCTGTDVALTIPLRYEFTALAMLVIQSFLRNNWEANVIDVTAIPTIDFTGKQLLCIQRISLYK